MTDLWVQDVELPLPSLKDNTADADRLIQALRSRIGGDVVTPELNLLRQLPGLLRNAHYRVRCVLHEDQGRWGISAVLPAEDRCAVLGLAVDLGTTRVVIRLLDMTRGEALGEASFDNPQIAVGPDILTRIHYADTAEGLDHLHRLIADAIGRHADALCVSAGYAASDIYMASVAGNTAMTHLFLGLNPRWIIREPYIPVVNRPGTFLASALDIRFHSSARVFVFPNIGSYFGGDLMAGILYAGLHRQEETAILVDVGTNAEVVLGNRDWMIACAGAAGPALEGGAARMGMMAGPGVIDRVSIHPETLQWDIHTIEDLPPVGICGSGLIDLAAQLFMHGMLDVRGKLAPDRCGDRIRVKDDLCHLVVVASHLSGTGEELTISQVDIDSLIRSKAAMYTILETITASVGMPLRGLTRFYVAGTFGAFINPVSAITIGMIPDLDVKCYQTIGNSSLEGATRLIQDPRRLTEIYHIRDSITYMELNVNQEFMNRFSAAKFLPHTEPALFPSVNPYRTS